MSRVTGLKEKVKRGEMTARAARDELARKAAKGLEKYEDVTTCEVAFEIAWLESRPTYRWLNKRLGK
jgi:hypothetical protein